MTVLIVGTAGAEPERLADALRAVGLAEVVVEDLAGLADHASADVRAAVLALDSSMPAADEEVGFLAALAEAEVPTALVACCVESFPNWPSVLAASRALLGPEHRLPVFATSAVLVAEPGASSGVPELARWCSSDHGGDHRPVSPPSEAARAVPAPGGGSQAVLRAERITGLRAGIVAARAEASSSLRAALVDVTALLPDACAAPDVVDWLSRAVDVIEHRARALFVHRMGQVRAAATCGLVAGGASAMIPDVADPPAAQTPPPRRRARPEDLMVLLVGASMGFGVGRMALAPALAWVGLGAAGTVLSIAAGLLIALWVVSVRRVAADRARRERWAAELLASRRAAVEHWIGACAGAAEAHVSREIWNRTRPARV